MAGLAEPLATYYWRVLMAAPGVFTACQRKFKRTAKCSQDTALRDIGELVTKGMLRKAEGGGRSTRYELIAI